MSVIESFAGPGDPNPIDARDLARDVVRNGGIGEETLTAALQRVREQKRAASGDACEQWGEAEQALLGALSAVRRAGQGQEVDR